MNHMDEVKALLNSANLKPLQDMQFHSIEDLEQLQYNNDQL